MNNEENIMNEYDSEKNKIKEELNKCSKSLLVKIILDRCIGHPFNSLNIDEIHKYKKYEQLVNLEKKINELDQQIDIMKCDTFGDIIKKNALLEESVKLSLKYNKILLEE